MLWWYCRWLIAASTTLCVWPLRHCVLQVSDAMTVWNNCKSFDQIIAPSFDDECRNCFVCFVNPSIHSWYSIFGLYRASIFWSTKHPNGSQRRIHDSLAIRQSRDDNSSQLVRVRSNENRLQDGMAARPQLIFVDRTRKAAKINKRTGPGEVHLYQIESEVLWLYQTTGRQWLIIRRC